MTAREFIAAVTEIADQLPDGLDSAIELVICDGSAQQFIDSVEVLYQAYVRMDDSADPEKRPQVVLVGHWHPGESPGRVQRPMVADADEELRKLTEGDT